MPTFDIEGARKAGISDAEIAAEMAKGFPQFDFAGARKAGIVDSDIINELSAKLKQPKLPVRLPPRNPVSELSAEQRAFQGVPSEPDTTPAWAGDYPNAYGVYGALTETPKTIGKFLGVDKITQPIAQIAAHTLARSNAERSGVGTPTAGELANAALNTGALLLPYGKVAGGITNVAGKVLPKVAATSSISLSLGKVRSFPGKSSIRVWAK